MRLVVDATAELVPVGVLTWPKTGQPKDLDKNGNPKLIQMMWTDETKTDLVAKLNRFHKPIGLDHELVPEKTSKKPKLTVCAPSPRRGCALN
jgi:hypothetical protein